jgi:hypothetical protein
MIALSPFLLSSSSPRARSSIQTVLFSIHSISIQIAPPLVRVVVISGQIRLVWINRPLNFTKITDPRWVPHPLVKNLDISTSYLLSPFYLPKMPRDIRENEVKLAQALDALVH